jgi:hypothetical protein
MTRQLKRDVLARERERRIRVRTAGSVPPGRENRSHAQPRPTSRRDAARTCGWCRGPIDTKGVGRIPKWCSAACRQRAWEQSRAAASGRAAVEIVERVVYAPVEHAELPRHGDWPDLLRELATQLDSGRIYLRDMPDVGAALSVALAAYERHPSASTRA